MKNMFKNKEGFTLIELLIVIAIIGIISSIILNTLKDSRNKANDSKVKQQLVGFRRAAELYYTNQSPNSYGASVAVCTGGMFADTSATNGKPNSYLTIWGGMPTPTLYCQSNATQYAVKGSLTDGSGWCVDSTNVSRAISVAQLVAGPAIVCP